MHGVNNSSIAPSLPNIALEIRLLHPLSTLVNRQETNTANGRRYTKSAQLVQCTTTARIQLIAWGPTTNHPSNQPPQHIIIYKAISHPTGSNHFLSPAPGHPLHPFWDGWWQGGERRQEKTHHGKCYKRGFISLHYILLPHIFLGSCPTQQQQQNHCQPYIVSRLVGRRMVGSD